MASVAMQDNGPDGCMRVQQGALQILDQIQQPVVVVAVVGLYRTGKSFLMNRLAQKQRGFALGSTIASETKGIWMWCVPHPSKTGHTLVLLDTEGLGDMDKGDEKHDTWIFCLAVLLSSTLVYNSMGTIDNGALEKLQYVTELTKLIQVKSSEYSQSTELMRVFPSFVWTVRDFTLELELDGKPITADEYLEKALKLKPGNKPEVARRNQVWQGLRDFFAVRRCFVFDRPASPKQMRRMEMLTDADLNESFLEDAKKFCCYIFNHAQPKTMRGGLGVTGRMLGCLAETYVEAIRSGMVPCLESAVETLVLIQNGRAVAEALAHYQREMQRSVQLPSETLEALSQIHSDASTQAISIFTKASFNDWEHTYQDELMRKMAENYGEWCCRNVEESRRACGEVLSRVFGPLEDSVSRGEFIRTGGYKEYRGALEHATALYRQQHTTGIMREEMLMSFLKAKMCVGESILAADHSLTQAEQQRQEEALLREQAERMRALEVEHTAMLQEVERKMQRTYEEAVRLMEEKMEEENRRHQEEVQRVLEAKLREQEAALKEQSGRHMRELEEEVTRLREEENRVKEEARRPKKKQGEKRGGGWRRMAADVLEIGGSVVVLGEPLLGFAAMLLGRQLNNRLSS